MTSKLVVPLAAVGVGALIAAGVIARGGAPAAQEAETLRSATGTEPVRQVPDRLPDLDQETPGQLRIKTVRRSGRTIYRLGFRSAVRNVGEGPLTVVGRRSDRETPYMDVRQLVERVGARPEVVPDVGRMKYTVSPDHRHWHYLAFERYELQRFELRSAGSANPLRTDRKTGFCLGDRYRVRNRRLPAAPPEPVFTGRCGLDQPERLRLRVGISVGYGDDYSAFLEGQSLRLDGLSGGRYVLVHRVNVDRGLRERSYRNNAASVLIRLRWRGGAPKVRVLAKCPATDRCGRG